MSNLFDRLQDEIDSHNKQDGISPIDLLDMPDAIAKIVKKMVRRNGLKLEEIAEEVDQPIEEIQKTLDDLVAKGLVRKVEVKKEIWYKARFAQKKNRTISSSFWAALDDIAKSEDDAS